MTATCVSIILPVYNEEGNIAACLRELAEALQGLEHEILVCYDFDEDRTLPAIAAMPDRPATLKLVRNTLGRGVAFAIRAGLQAARGDVLVTMMADLSDPPDVIPKMAEKIRIEGADVVSGSRYMKGGAQTGGPPLKTFLSRTASLSLHWIAGLGTHDATTNFRAYSRRCIQQIPVESTAGFELALEVTVKAHHRGFKVNEVPSTWKDRSAGESRFRLAKWLPRYLRWYFSAMGAPLFVWGVLLAAFVAALRFSLRHAPPIPFWPDEWAYVPLLTGEQPFTLDWLFAFHNEHWIPLPKLAWWLLGRLSGIDSRWGVTLNVSLLAAAAAVLISALRKLRGRTLWTDAFLPLLLLHWGHWENMTWPFQVAFTLPVFLLFLVISAILGHKGRAPDPCAWSFGIPLLLLSLCGPIGTPTIAILVPSWIGLAWRGDRSRLGRSIALPALALLIVGFGLVGYPRSTPFPPSPRLAADVQVAFEALASGLGSPGAAYWTLSGWSAGAAALLAFALLIRGYHRNPDSRIACGGMIGVLSGLLLLALALGHSRAGVSLFFGFTPRYVTIFCPLPFVLFAAAELCGRPLLAKTLQLLLFVSALLAWAPNASRATDDLAPRRQATQRLIEDLRSGTPTPVLARRHAAYWCPGDIPLFERGLEGLDRSRTAIYRTLEPTGR